MSAPRALLVWQQVGDPLPKDMSRLYNALSIAALDISEQYPGCVALRQGVARAQASGLDHTGWTLGEEQTAPQP